MPTQKLLYIIFQANMNERFCGDLMKGAVVELMAGEEFDEVIEWFVDGLP